MAIMEINSEIATIKSSEIFNIVLTFVFIESTFYRRKSPGRSGKDVAEAAPLLTDQVNLH